MKLNKKEFIAYMAEKNGMKKVEATALINTFIDTMLEATAEGYDVCMLGEMSTKIKDVAERAYDNPQDRTEKIVIKAHKKVTMKLGSKFQLVANGEDFVDTDEE